MPQPEYFELFPAIPYTFSPEVNKDITIATNILSRVRFRRVVLDYSVVFYDFWIPEGDSPDILAHKLYGDSKYHYIILFANDIYNIYEEWPRPSNVFISYLKKKYNTSDITILQKMDWTLTELSEEPAPVAAFYNWKHRQIDFSTYENDFLYNSAEYKPYYLTFYDYEFQKNENKRKIVLPNSSYVPRIHKQMFDLMNQGL
jgi:hypothetical protein